MDLTQHVRVVDPRVGSVQNRAVRLPDIEVDAAQAQRDSCLIERGVWSEVCRRRVFPKALAASGAPARLSEDFIKIAQKLVKGVGLGSIGGITLNATAREKASKLQGVCVEAVILWVYEEEHPDPWSLLAETTLRYSKPSKVPTVYANEFTKQIRQYRESLPVQKMTCAGCGKGKLETHTLKVCSACGVTRYCSDECQGSHWREHKPLCDLLARRKAFEKNMRARKTLRVRDCKKWAKAAEDVEKWLKDDEERSRERP